MSAPGFDRSQFFNASLLSGSGSNVTPKNDRYHSVNFFIRSEGKRDKISRIIREPNVENAIVHICMWV